MQTLVRLASWAFFSWSARGRVSSSSAGTTNGARSSWKGRSCPAGRSTMLSSIRATARSTPARTAGSTAARSSARPTSARPGTRSEGLGLPEESGLKLASTWHLEPGHPSEPGTLWLGGEPGVALPFRRLGATWQVNEGVLGPRDPREVERLARRADHALDHARPRRCEAVVDRISAAGVFRTEDAGATWQPANVGTEACFLPEDRYPEVGQCVHKVLAHPGQAGAVVAAEPLRRLPLRRSRQRAGNGSTETGFRRASCSV